MEMRRPYKSLLVKPLYYLDQNSYFFHLKLQNMKMIMEKDKSFAI